ncbi:hypothetical protein [Streptomyces phaeochromogenes]|uniref:hypothetical protein n=1 Tax=Streptomyces phaeochromogenes TaxID=1923 RepID=UPI0033D86CC0
MPPARVPRSAVWGAALLATVLVAGCSNGADTARDSSLDSAAGKSSAPSTPGTSSAPKTPTSPAVEPEASGRSTATDGETPAISYQGKTKVVTLGDTEIRATRNELGINVACNSTNSTDRTHNITVTVSVGDGKDWVTTNEFDFRQVAAGRTASENVVMGASFEGELPDDPKIYIDSVIYY